jgi:hypothetical protein
MHAPETVIDDGALLEGPICAAHVLRVASVSDPNLKRVCVSTFFGKQQQVVLVQHHRCSERTCRWHSAVSKLHDLQSAIVCLWELAVAAHA